MQAFSEHILEEKSDDFIASYCTVYTDGGGYFVTVCTDDYEGCAQMTLPVARRLIGVLTKAVEAAEREREAYRAKTA